MNKNIDILVYGATGYTGKCVVKELAYLTKEKYRDVTWGVAGRSKEKLQNLVKELNKTGLGKDLTTKEADVDNEESLKKMLQDVKVVVNCTGPNIILSPKIVKVCIETGTHYVDISAEMLHILKLYQNYNKPAENANVLIMPACGYSAIPVETAMMYLERQFKGTLHTVECYTQIFMPVFGKVVLHNGTWTSVVHVMETFKEHLALKRQIFPKPIGVEPKEMKKSFFHRNNGHLWFWYPGVEDSVVEMSQRYLYEKTQKKPVNYKTYITVEFCFQFLVVFFIFLYYYLSYFKFFRELLMKFPSLFTLGYVSEKGPSEKTRQNMTYYFTLNAKGWELDEDLNSEPKKSLSVKVSGQGPGYNTTATACIMSAITILKEGANMPKGGVVTPGAALYKTDIVDRLTHAGYTYSVVQK